MRLLILLALALILPGCAVGSTFDDEPMVGLRVGEKTVANAARRVVSAGMDIAGTLGLVGGTGGLGLLAAWGAKRYGEVKGKHDGENAGFQDGIDHAHAAQSKADADYYAGRADAHGALPVVAGAAGASGGGVPASAAGVTA